MIYELLSSNFKVGLVKESEVKNAEDYEKLRRSSEAKWSQFSVKGEQSESKERITFTISTPVEEAGETSQTAAANGHLAQEDSDEYRG
jgi:hypothetical protein